MSPAALLALLLLGSPVQVVLDAPEDAPPDTSLSWRAWTPGLGLQATPTLPSDQLGSAAARTLRTELPSADDRWTVLVEGTAGGDSWFAVAVGGGVERAPLLPVPAPVAERDGEGVLVRWDALAPPGVAGWQVLRVTEGGEPELVGEVATRRSTFRDDPPAGETAWALRPVLAEGVTGPLGRLSEPLQADR